MQKIKFNKDYPKLGSEIFTTIRTKNKKLDLRELVRIESPSHSFKARVIGGKYIRLGQIGLFDLEDDIGYKSETYVFGTDKHYQLLLEEFRKIYPSITLDTFVYYYTFRRI